MPRRGLLVLALAASAMAQSPLADAAAALTWCGDRLLASGRVSAAQRAYAGAAELAPEAPVVRDRPRAPMVVVLPIHLDCWGGPCAASPQAARIAAALARLER